jgi:hypothetical protein
MSQKSKWDYLKAIYFRYQKASKPLRSHILDEFCQVCGYNRKYAIRLLSGPAPQRTKNHRQRRRPTYGDKMIAALAAIWEAAGYPCSARIKALLPLWLPWAIKRLALSAQTQKQLLSISPATIDRRLKPKKRQLKKRLYGRAAVPPLLLFGKPGVVFAWALPGNWRRNFLSSKSWRCLTGLGETLSRPSAAAVLHGLALWLWHAPAPFNAAVASYTVHALEHSAFLGTALLFWRAILDGRSSRRAGPALGASFATLIHSALLGALITMAPYPLYSWYRGGAEVWGLSALEDQQLAGLLMWVPMGIVYLAACLVLASRLVVEVTSPGEARPVESVSAEEFRS